MSKKFNILLLEDDSNFGSVLQMHLNMLGYDVTLCVNGQDGLEQWQKGKYDLILADIMMPKMDGFTFVETVRKTDSEIPIIFLTAKSFKEDKIRGFQVGCDDYITKPFSIEELTLRMGAILRRIKKDYTDENLTFQIGQYRFDYNRQQLIFGERIQKLTPRESDLLHILIRNKNRIVSRKQALDEIWNDDSFFAGRSMDVFVSKLRKYLKKDSSVEIVGVHGKGFRLIVE